MTLDEIIAKLGRYRDHGPNLHEMVYQLALAVRAQVRSAAAPATTAHAAPAGSAAAACPVLGCGDCVKLGEAIGFWFCPEHAE